MKTKLFIIAMMLLMGCETEERVEPLKTHTISISSEQLTNFVMTGYHLGRSDPNGFYADSVAVRNIFIKNFNK